MAPLKSLALSSYLIVVTCVLTTFGSPDNISSPPAPPSLPGDPHRGASATGIGTGLEPKDYPYSPSESRVPNLISFYEAMLQNQYDPDVIKKQNVLISLSEAASKLYLLSYGYSLDIKCNKYVKLIERPNIRSFVTVRELMNEPRHFSEVEQKDANLLPRLVSERKFDALSKLQTIFQTLESERIGGRSSFEPNVQKDLLHCMNYYIYRHQRATTGLVDYIRVAREKLDSPEADDMISDAKLKKFSELIESIKQIEQVERKQSHLQTNKWLDEFSKLYEFALENHFELSKLVEEFVNDPTRTKRLNEYGQALVRANELHAALLETESLADYNQTILEKDIAYKSSLMELYALYLNYEDVLPSKIGQYLNRSDRLQMIETPLTEKAEHSQDSEKATLNSAIEDAIENIQSQVESAHSEERKPSEQSPVVVQPEPVLEPGIEIVPLKETTKETEEAKIEEPKEVGIEHAGQQQAEPDEMVIENGPPKLDSGNESSNSSEPSNSSESSNSNNPDSSDDIQSGAPDKSDKTAAPRESEEPAVSEPQSPSIPMRLSVLRRVETCSRLATDLKEDVRSFNPTRLNAEQARRLAMRVNSFHSNGCMRKNAEYCANSCQSSQWACHSLSKKLLDWTINKMPIARSLPRSEQANLWETLNLLQPVAV